MVKLVVIVVSILMMSFTTKSNEIVEVTKIESISSSYCEGWEDGYKEGWCYGQGYGCLEPLVPLCPLARLGEDGYKDGYHRGFLKGKKDRQNL